MNLYHCPLCQNHLVNDPFKILSENISLLCYCSLSDISQKYRIEFSQNLEIYYYNFPINPFIFVEGNKKTNSSTLKWWDNNFHSCKFSQFFPPDINDFIPSIHKIYQKLNKLKPFQWSSSPIVQFVTRNFAQINFFPIAQKIIPIFTSNILIIIAHISRSLFPLI